MRGVVGKSARGHGGRGRRESRGRVVGGRRGEERLSTVSTIPKLLGEGKVERTRRTGTWTDKASKDSRSASRASLGDSSARGPS